MRVHFRSFVYSWIMVMAAIFCCLIAYNNPALGAILLAIVVFLPLAIAFLLKKKLKTHIFASIIMTSCICLVATAFFFIKVDLWDDGIKSGKHEVAGVIDEIYEGDETKVILDDLSIDGKEVGGRMSVTVVGELPTLTKAGYYARFVASIKVRELVSGLDVNASYLRSDIRYTSALSVSAIEFVRGPDRFSISRFIDEKLKSNMGDKYGAVAFGMLTGDKNEITSDIIGDFSASGVAHVLAVSGLHIGVLAGIIAFVLRKLHIKRLLSFLITLGCLLLYATIADFSPSVMRACAMYAVGGGALLLGEQNDGFNSLGAAATFVLLFDPLMLFEAGFLMSVGAVFGIVNFSPLITRALVRIKIPEKLSSAVAVTTAAQLGILPPLISFFGYIQTYSVIINLFMLPFMSLAFVAVFVSLLFALIPPLSFLLKASSVLIRGMIVGASIGASLPYAQIVVSTSNAAFLLYPLYFLSGDYVCFKYKVIKPTIACVAVVLLITLIFI